jgi:hypothetical protein
MPKLSQDLILFLLPSSHLCKERKFFYKESNFSQMNIELHITLMSGQIIDLEMSSDATIRHVKKKLEPELQVYAPSIILFVDSNYPYELSNELRLGTLLAPHRNLHAVISETTIPWRLLESPLTSPELHTTRLHSHDLPQLDHWVVTYSALDPQIKRIVVDVQSALFQATMDVLFEALDDAYNVERPLFPKHFIFVVRDHADIETVMKVQNHWKEHNFVYSKLKWEIDRKEIEQREIDRKEIDRKEIDRKEIEQREIE